MILIIQGHLPFASSDRELLYEAWARRVPLIHIHPDSSGWRPLAALAGGDSFPLTPGDAVRLPLPGFLPLSRWGRIGQWNRWFFTYRLLRRLRQRTDEPLILMAQYPFLLPTFRGLPADLTVYDVVDDYISSKEPHRARQIEQDHARFLACSDAVWALSLELLDAIRPHRPDVVSSRLGVDWNAFSQAADQSVVADMAAIASPRIGLVGRLNDRIDWDLVLELVRRRPEWNFVFVGPIYGSEDGTRRTRAVLSAPHLANLHHLPAVAPERVPAFTAAFDVCLIPYPPRGANRAINPLKSYQALAAGRPVVAYPLRSLKKFGEHVFRAETADDFEAMIAAAITANATPQAVAMRQEAVRMYDWQEVANYMLELIQRTLDHRLEASHHDGSLPV